MVSVWYVGPADEEVMTTAAWATAGIPGRPEVSWNEANGWSLPHSLFTSDQLTWLHDDEEFLINQTDTPRDSIALDPNNRKAYATRAYVQNLLLQGAIVTGDREVIAGDGLEGGGPLSSDVTLSVVYGDGDNTAVEGNDSRVVLAQSQAEKNQPSGYAGLDGSGKVVIGQIPTGTSGSTVPFGNDSRFTDQRVPTDGSVTNAKVHPSAAILASKLDSASFDAQVRTSRVDQMATPTAPVSMGGQLITNAGSPASSTDVATKGYVDSVRQGFAGAKDPVRLAMSTNVSPTAPGATLDGLTMVADDRVLLTNQTTTTQNGIYVWNSAASLTRALDSDNTGEVVDGTTVAVAEGTNAGKIYIQTSTPSGSPGSWTQQWVIFNTSGTTYTASAGVDLVGNDFRLTSPVTVARGGTGGGDAATARTNLGLGTAAVTNTGTGSANTILGNDARLTDARVPTAHAASHALGGTDPVTPSSLGAAKEAPGLWAWRQAFAKRRTKVISVVAGGSSTTDGYNTTNLDDRYTNRIGFDLHTLFNPTGVAGGSHIRGNDSGWSFTGTHGTTSNGLGLTSISLAAGATMTRTVNIANTTGFEVYFEQGSGAGTFTVAVDGGSAVTVTPDTNGNANRHDGVYSSPTLSSGSHNLVITSTTACVISGIYARNGDETTGIRMYNSGLAGTNSNSFAVASMGFYQRLASLPNLGLVILMLGANDYSAAVNPSTFQANVQTTVDRIIATCTPTPSILLVGTYPRQDVFFPTYTWSQYLDRMAAVAAANPGVVDYIDISGGYPTTQAADQAFLMIDPVDYVHQTPEGHQFMGDKFRSRIWTAPEPVAYTAPAFDPRQISKLKAWFDAGTISQSNNTAVASWTPVGGLERAPAVQATGGQQPLFRTGRTPSGRASVGFTAASTQSLDTGVWDGKWSTPLSTLSVVKLNTGNVGNIYTGRSGVYAYMGNGPSGTLAIGAGAVGEISQSCAMDTWLVILAIYNGASPNSIIALSSHLATATGTTTTGANSALPGLKMGTNSGSTANWLDGEISELAVWGKALTSYEITALANWAGTRHSIAIA